MSLVAHTFAVQVRSASNAACAAGERRAAQLCTHASSAHGVLEDAQPDLLARQARGRARFAGVGRGDALALRAGREGERPRDDQGPPRGLAEGAPHPRLQWLVPERVPLMTSMSSARCCGLPTKSMSEALTMSSGPSP